MAYTIEQLFTRACSLVDSLKTDGTIDANTTADYRGRTLTLVDMAQKELLRQADYYKIFEFSRKPIQSMYGFMGGFDMEEYKADADLSFEVSNDKYGGVKAYYFEADGSTGTVYIEDYTSQWNTLATISLTNTGIGFVAYSGAVTPTVGATKSRIRFSGQYYYRVVNRALFNYAFQANKVPVYRPWVPVEMPTDMKTIDKVITEYPPLKYAHDLFYKIEWSGNRQTLYIDYYFEGKVRVQYKPIPTTPTSMNDLILVDDVTAQAICYYLAMNFVATEQNEYLTGLFKAQYDKLKLEAGIKQPSGTTSIIDVYGL